MLTRSILDKLDEKMDKQLDDKRTVIPCIKCFGIGAIEGMIDYAVVATAVITTLGLIGKIKTRK